MPRPTRDASGQIQRQSGNGGGGGGDSLDKFLLKTLAPQIAVALPKHLTADRMTRIALTALRTTPKLSLCDTWSFAACVLQAAQLGLEINTPLGHAYLIPRRNRRREERTGDKSLECTLQIGYQGMIDLARRSGQVSTIYSFTVHDSDDFEYELGLDPKLRHIPKCDNPTEQNMLFVYAVAALKGDEHDRQFVVLPKRTVNQRKARGQGGPAWDTDYLAMARKTAVRALFTWLPKSPEMARASTLDDREVTGHALPAVIDAAVVDQLAEMQLPTPDDDGDDEPADEAPKHDPSTGEVAPEDEPTDAQLGLDSKKD